MVIREVNNVTKKIILASHGKFASGILTSLELICGKQEHIQAVDCYVTPQFDIAETVEALLKEKNNDETIVVTDIFGGSVNNEFIRYIEQPSFYLVAGLNLPFLIELVTNLHHMETKAAIQRGLTNAKQSIQFCNETIKNEVEEDEF